MASQSMNAVADRFASQGIASIFLYTHEAHPAEHYPPLRSMEQKTRHAEALRDVYGVTRPILLDALDGACHRAYGGYPNMTWIFNRRGQPLYKADWTDSGSVARTLEMLTSVNDRRRGGERLSSFRVEMADFRVDDNDGFYAGLERNGQQAVDDFIDTFPQSAPDKYRK